MVPVEAEQLSNKTKPKRNKHLRLPRGSLGLLPVGERHLQPLEDPGPLFGRRLVEDLLQGGDLPCTEENARPAQPERLRRHLKPRTRHTYTGGRVRRGLE